MGNPNVEMADNGTYKSLLVSVTNRINNLQDEMATSFSAANMELVVNRINSLQGEMVELADNRTSSAAVELASPLSAALTPSKNGNSMNFITLREELRKVGLVVQKSVGAVDVVLTYILPGRTFSENAVPQIDYCKNDDDLVRYCQEHNIIQDAYRLSKRFPFAKTEHFFWESRAQAALYCDSVAKGTHVVLQLGVAQRIKTPAGTYKRIRKMLRRCAIPECDKTAQTGGNCFAHGGGKHCSKPDCNSRALLGGNCYVHGGGRRCAVDDCIKACKINGFCHKHNKANQALFS